VQTVINKNALLLKRQAQETACFFVKNWWDRMADYEFPLVSFSCSEEVESGWDTLSSSPHLHLRLNIILNTTRWVKRQLRLYNL
jgi:hypothetical protein